MVTPTALLTDDEARQVRDLMDTAFDDFTDLDWSHTLGGLHALVRDGAEIVGHGSLVQRRLLVEGRSLRGGYLQSVAVHPDCCRRGLGSQVMAELEAHASGYDILALRSSTAGVPFYRARGWQLWRGPTAVLSPEGLQPTPEADGTIYVLGGPHGQVLDLDAPIACDWRDGDVW